MRESDEITEKELIEWEIENNRLAAEYLVLPRRVADAILQNKVSLLGIKIYAIVQSLSFSEKGSSVSNWELSQICGASEGAISRVISQMKEMGFLEQTSFDGRTRFLDTTGESKCKKITEFYGDDRDLL